MMPEWLWPLFSAVASFAGAWGGLRVQLRGLRRDIDSAHLRLDRLGAPSVYVPHGD